MMTVHDLNGQMITQREDMVARSCLSFYTARNRAVRDRKSGPVYLALGWEGAGRGYLGAYVEVCDSKYSA